jgi:hypothetical protein
MKLKYFVPLIGFAVPTVVITAVMFTLAPPHISQRIGFLFLMAGVCGSYYLGIRSVLADREKG